MQRSTNVLRYRQRRRRWWRLVLLAVLIQIRHLVSERRRREGERGQTRENSNDDCYSTRFTNKFMIFSSFAHAANETHMLLLMCSVVTPRYTPRQCTESTITKFLCNNQKASSCVCFFSNWWMNGRRKCMERSTSDFHWESVLIVRTSGMKITHAIASFTVRTPTKLLVQPMHLNKIPWHRFVLHTNSRWNGQFTCVCMDASRFIYCARDGYTHIEIETEG